MRNITAFKENKRKNESKNIDVFISTRDKKYSTLTSFSIFKLIVNIKFKYRVIKIIDDKLKNNVKLIIIKNIIKNSHVKNTNNEKKILNEIR